MIVGLMVMGVVWIMVNVIKFNDYRGYALY